MSFTYDIPASVRPIVDAYVSAGFDFIALRLAPGQGVQAMQPVRVVTPGAGLTLPLRMVAAGVGAKVGITLYVIGDGRYQAQNFLNGTVDDSKLVWLHPSAESNYEPLAEQIMQGGGGRTWLTEFAGGVSLEGSPGSVTSNGGYACGSVGTGGQAGQGGTSTGGGAVSTYVGESLANVYYAQCLCLAAPACLVSPDASSGEGSDAGESGDAGGGLVGADPTCNACTAFDDLTVASVGLDPSSTWITRMRAILPASALTDGDLVVEASPTQAAVSNQHKASTYDDPTYDPCSSAGASGNGASGRGCSAADTPPEATGRALVIGSLALLAAMLLRRRRLASR